jgi:hypothetical protein
MELTRSEAAGALHDIERAQTRTAEMRGYQRAAPYLLMWGAIWALGYSLMAVRPPSDWGWIWLPLDAVGIAGSIAMGVRHNGKGMSLAARRSSARSMVAAFFILAFIVATYTVFAPANPAPYIVFPGLVAGLIYGVCGVLWMPRLGWIGVAIFALTLVGFFFFPASLLPWMAVVGGGGLFLGGWWLRSA